MLIHKSFSRKDLIAICEALNIQIEDISDYNKHQLTNKFDEWVTNNPQGLFLPNVLCIDNTHQLVTYLSTINQSKINSQMTRDMVMKTAKKLIAYGKNGYTLTIDLYTTIDQVKEDVDMICEFGDSPSVRKAIEWINNDPNINEKYFPIISEAVKKKLEEKKTMKSVVNGKLRVKYGHFVIRFD
tara:strand:- start:152 stop:703 length:552 start_codon:yes stop_codon:yes gene_type:complete